MKLTLIILNLLASGLVFPAMSLLHKTHLTNAAMMYVELDRAGVIDRSRLEAMYPKEAKNDRQDIPKRYIGQNTSEWIVGYPCICGFVANALLIGIFWKRNGKAEPEAPEGHPEAGRPRA